MMLLSPNASSPPHKEPHPSPHRDDPPPDLLEMTSPAGQGAEVEDGEADPDTVSCADGTQRSKTCLVCKAVSETYHLNYGASTCFSCRAFFRRALQNSRNRLLDDTKSLRGET